ncbi:MAG: glycosyltransferase [Acidobacteriia bacterium]|nr:glycosyltransferase [Terriglobia bacterium]
MRICLIGATHACHNPRLVREADTLAERGHEVRVVAVRSLPELIVDDERLIATRKWRFSAANILRSPWANRIRAIPSRLRRESSARSFQRTGSAADAEIAFCEAAPELLRLAAREPADWFVAHTQAVLATAARAARQWNARLGFDCEDLLSETGLAQPELVRVLERACLPACDYVTAASPAMAERLQQQYRIPAPTVLYNVFPLAMARELKPPEQRSPNACLRLHWSGQTAGPGKGLEEAIVAAALAGGGVELFVRGTPADDFQATLFRMAREKNVPLTFLPHVPHDELVGTMGQFDVGLALERASDRNYSLTVTNKFFSYMLAGLAIAATDTPGQRDVLQQVPAAGFIYPCGCPEALAEQLRGWRDNRASLLAAQCAAWQAARDRYCWDVEKTKYLALFERPGARQAVTGVT